MNPLKVVKPQPKPWAFEVGIGSSLSLRMQKKFFLAIMDEMKTTTYWGYFRIFKTADLVKTP